MKILSVAGDRVAILLGGEETGGAYAVMEAALPPGSGPPLHVHSREDETFQVLAGEVTFYLGGKTILLKKGEYLFAPRGIPHQFKNTGNVEAVLLETAAPAGIEKFFEAAGHALSTRRDAPLAVTAEDVARMRAISTQFGIEILVPAPK